MTSHVVDSYIVQNDVLQLRIIEYAENGWVAGAYYVFEWAPAASKKWRRITIFRFDDPLWLPRNQARFVSGKIAFIFLGWKYAVTTDGGENWSVWTAPAEIRHFKLIQDVDLQPNGSGTMRCSVLSERHDKSEERLFETGDYGRTWKPKGSNHAMQPTAGRRTFKFPMTPTSLSAATRAPASGG